MAAILQIVLTGFFVGGLARWAVPGPDPMPFWLTVLFGLGGSVVGGSIAAAVFGTRAYFWILLLGVAAAAGLVVAYRMLVQKRPITGPEAYRLPTRGVGVARMRARLRQLGIDPNAVGRGDDERSQRLRALRKLHDDGVLTDEEYEERVRRLDERR